MPNPSISAQLFQHARRLAPPFLSHEGLACAPIPFATFAHDMLPLRSHSFRQWLLRTFLTEHELFPSRNAIRAAIQMLDALATDPDTPRRSIDLRISSSGSPLRPDAILLDLASADGDAVEITAAGWNIRTPSTPLRRSRTAQPLPLPESAPTDDAATQPLTLPGFALQPACLAWLLAALRPAGPYPILILQGPPASGKTLLARMLRSLVDPAGSPFCRAARNPPDLLRLAWNNYVLAFDHVTHLPADISDSLCRLSAGAGFAFDEQTDGSDVLTRFARPIILTTPTCRSTQLRNRAIVVDLPRIPSHARRGETELIHEFWDAQPRIFARLCSAISYAMSATPASTFQAMPAFVDAANWAVAAAPSLGITEEQMRAALTTDAFAQDLAAFIHEAGTWEGTPTELLSILQARGAADLPATAARLSRKIHISTLRAHGVEIKHMQGHTGRRIRATVDLHATVAEAHFA